MDCCSTLLIFRKQTPAFFFIAVDLPKAGTFTPFAAVFYEAADVLRRITEKKSDFMGEFLTFRNSPDQTQYAKRQIVCRIASFLKQSAGCMILQIQRQPGWTKHIDQSPVFAKAKRQQPQTFFPRIRFHRRRLKRIASSSSNSQLKRLPVFRPASVGAQWRTSISSDMILPPHICPLYACMFFQDGSQCSHGTAVGTCYFDILCSCITEHSADHFMGYRAGKQYEKVR